MHTNETLAPVTQCWPEDFAARYRAAGYWRGETFGALLRTRAQAHPHRIALVDGARRWTYAELDARADAVAQGVTAAGLAAGARVVVQLPNCAEFYAVIFGLFRAGVLPVYSLFAHRLSEVEHAARSAQADAYVVAALPEFFTLAAELQARLPALRHVVVVEDGQGQNACSACAQHPGWRTLSDLERGGTNTPLPPEPKPSDVAFLQLSGGSTGLSKLIPRTHDDYLYTLRESARICALTSADTFLVVLPAAHNFPMSSPGALGALYAGATVVLARTPTPEAAFALIETERVTMTSLVPPLLLAWLQAHAMHPTHDLSSLKTIQVGGAKLAAEVARRVRPVLGATLQQVFGMAEGLVNYTRLDDPEDIITETQGRPISPDDEIRVVDDNDRDVAPGASGYLLTRGPYTIRAYHANPAANAKSFTEDGFYRTGDVVRLTPQGYLVVQGRADDHINRAGEKISAEEIEDHLLAHPQIFDAVVVSVPDALLGERSCAFLIAQDHATHPKPVEIKRWMRTRGLADFKIPDQVVFVQHFHQTAVGKISRKALRAQLRQRLDGETS